MSAKDIFHDKVKTALIKDGWTITDDPFSLKWDDNENLFVDLAAEKVIAAEKGKDKIAVEIKTFIGKSTMYDLHLAIGQFLVYQTALEEKEPDRILFLAVPIEILNEVFLKPKAIKLTQKVNLKIIGFDIETEEIVQWKK
jgi:XisH protein